MRFFKINAACNALLFMSLLSLGNSNNAFSADTGIITVTARIIASTCQVDINGATDAVVNLPTMPVGTFTPGHYSDGVTPFTINVSGCTPSKGTLPDGTVTVILAKAEQAGGLDIPPSGGTATNVVFRVNQNDVVRAWGPQGTLTYPITITDGKGSLEGMQVYYHATQVPAGAGTLTAMLTVSLQYN